MSEAPERIWMDGDIEKGDGYWTRCFEDRKPCSEPALEYVRADHSAALVAAAYEAAGDRCRNTEGLTLLEAQYGFHLAGEISALTPADATAKLEALIQKAVAEAIEAYSAGLAEGRAAIREGKA